MCYKLVYGSSIDSSCKNRPLGLAQKSLATYTVRVGRIMQTTGKTPVRERIPPPGGPSRRTSGLLAERLFRPPGAFARLACALTSNLRMLLYRIKFPQCVSVNVAKIAIFRLCIAARKLTIIATAITYRLTYLPGRVGSARAQVQCGGTADELRNLTIPVKEHQVRTPGSSKARESEHRIGEILESRLQGKKERL